MAIHTAHSVLKVFEPFYSLIIFRSYPFLQSTRGKVNTICANKAKLFLIISAFTTTALLPAAILPHINQPFFVYRSCIHVASIVISVFLVVVSILTYKKTRSIKILYTSFAFLSLLVVELLFLLQLMEGTSRIIIPFAYAELPHLLLLTMLALFGIGVLRVEK